MKGVEYTRIHSKYLPLDIKQLYYIDEIIDKDGYVYIKITTVMYGLKHADIMAHKN